MSRGTKVSRKHYAGYETHTYELSENVDVDVLEQGRQLEPLLLFHVPDIAEDEEAADVV